MVISVPSRKVNMNSLLLPTVTYSTIKPNSDASNSFIALPDFLNTVMNSSSLQVGYILRDRFSKTSFSLIVFII